MVGGFDCLRMVVIVWLIVVGVGYWLCWGLLFVFCFELLLVSY